MSLRRVDARFLLPGAPQTAVVLDGLDEWRDGLADVGVDVGEDPATAPDLAAAPAALVRAALVRSPRAVIAEGGGARLLARTGYHVTRVLARPSVERPALLLPLADRLAARYAIDSWSVVDRPWKQARKAVARELAARRALPGLGHTIAVATKAVGPPYMVAAAGEHFALPSGLSWVLTLGQGDVLSRNAFHLFRAGEPTPEWVVKFARVPHYRDPFDRDEWGLRLAARAAGVVAARAPRLLARFDHQGVHASLETAATGARLRERLQAPGRRAAKLRMLDEVAAWIVELGLATAVAPSKLDSERARLQREVLPSWPGADAELLAALGPVPGVLQHNDLGTWNIVLDRGGFTAVDWESAREHGLPLWDLLYFLADALAMLDGAWVGNERPRHTVRLFLGDLPSSAVLFRWTRRAVEALGIPPGAVGPLATLCWLHHSLSHVARRSALDRFAADSPTPLHGVEGTAALWLDTPHLRTGWTHWRGGA